MAGQCFLHKDGLNDTTPGYTRTGCFDMIIDDADGTVYLLQILGNFRNSAGNSLSKGATKLVEAISLNIDVYFLKLQEHYLKMMKENTFQTKQPRIFSRAFGPVIRARCKGKVFDISLS